MFIKKCLLFIFVMCFSYLVQSQERQVMLPLQYSSDVMNKQRISEEDFFYYRYNSDSIDLRHFKQMIPSLDVPDFIKIELPNSLGFHQDTVILLGVIDKKQNSNDLIIWLAGDYNSNEVTFYIDRTLDRKFNNDGPPIIINSQQGKKAVKLKPLGKSKQKTVFLSVTPKKNASFKEKLKIGKWKEKIENQISLEVSAGFGVGNIHYDYNNTESGFPSWYDVKLSAKVLGLNVSYDTKNFRLGFGFNYQNLFYYTSYTRDRYGIDEIRFTSMGQQLFERVEVVRNKEVQPTNLLQYSVMGAYKIRLGTFTHLVPTVAVGITKYQKNEFLPNRVITDERYQLKGDRFIDLGLRTEFTIGKFKAVFIGLSYNRTNWDPVGFVDSLNQEDYRSEFQIWRGLVGYRLAL